MSVDGFVTEDDLILYAMQALSSSEMEQVSARLADQPELANRLAEIQTVLGFYASATTELQEVPSAALDRLQRSIASEKPISAPRVVAPVSRRATGWGVRMGLLWGGWAVATLLLVGLGLQYQQNRRTQQNIAAAEANLRKVQTQATTLTAERDRLQSSLQQQSGQIQASRQEASTAESRSDNLSTKVAESNLRAQREAARAEELAATASEGAAERSQLKDALSREQQTAAAASESQQVLAALADPTALHVTLTVPKQKKRPSGRGTYLASNGTLVFTASDLSALPAGKVYELWLMPANGSSPIPAGTFTPDSTGNATLISSHFQRLAAKGFAITVEAAGGSLKPTLPILLAGSA